MANEPSDVELQDGRVLVRAPDLCLDSQDRRSLTAPGGPGHPRRAFVHDFQDGLTINWANDYPGGVTVRGLRTVLGYNGWVNMDNATINGQMQTSELLSHQTNVNGPLHALLAVSPPLNVSRPMQGISDDEFRQTSGTALNELVQMLEQGSVQTPFNVKVDLVDAVASLTSLVLHLRDRVRKLEAGSPP